MQLNCRPDHVAAVTDYYNYKIYSGTYLTLSESRGVVSRLNARPSYARMTRKPKMRDCKINLNKIAF